LIYKILDICVSSQQLAEEVLVHDLSVIYDVKISISSFSRYQINTLTPLIIFSRDTFLLTKIYFVAYSQVRAVLNDL
jgi:hypothetical protein